MINLQFDALTWTSGWNPFANSGGISVEMGGFLSPAFKLSHDHESHEQQGIDLLRRNKSHSQSS